MLSTFLPVLKPAFTIPANKYQVSHRTLKQSSLYNTNEISFTALNSNPNTKQKNPIENDALETLKKNEWKGITHSTSPFVTHYIANNSSNRNATVEDAILSVLQDIYTDKEQQLFKTSSLIKTQKIPDPTLIPIHRQLTPVELLALGSIWFLPDSAPKDPSLGTKPIRLSLHNANQILNPGDYLRIHHSPRRFPMIRNYNWEGYYKNTFNETIQNTQSSMGVIVAEDIELGYIIINKPAGVPVHSTVDNELENVSSEISRMLLKRNANQESKFDDTIVQTNYQRKQPKYPQKASKLVYVTTPQRLDQNTSGLFVVSTKKSFASYFAKLLSQKTQEQLLQQSMNVEKEQKNVNTNTRKKLEFYKNGSIHKKYKCLVCMFKNEKDSSSLHDQTNTLRHYYKTRKIMIHYLKPSIKAPKTFVSHPPSVSSMIESSDTSDISSWSKCLLRIVGMSDVFSIIGNENSKEQKLALRLWGNKLCIPKNCIGVVELEVELLTGRTHQIRGQLSTEGFPLVGDALYGGAIPQSIFIPHKTSQNTTKTFFDSEMLALQCCELSFLNPKNINFDHSNDDTNEDNNTWNTFRLDEAWWSHHLQIS